MPVNCVSCGTGISKQKPSISCSKCKNQYHVTCTDLPVDFVKLRGVSWTCKPCLSSADPSHDCATGSEPTLAQLLSVISAIRDDIASFKTEQSVLAESVKFYGQKIDDFQVEISGFREILKEFKSLKMQVTALKEDNARLQKELNDSQQYTRLNNLEINGVPETKNENILQIVESISQAVGVKVNRSSIDACHRVPTRIPNKPKPIVVKFVSRITKDELLAASKKKRGVSSSAIGIPTNESTIYVNEHLTISNKKLYGETRSLCKEKNYKYCWTKDCKIFVRKGDDTRVIGIDSSESLKKIV